MFKFMGRSWWAQPLTTQASLMASNWVLFLCAGAVVALVIWGLVGFALVRWRRKRGAAPTLPAQRRTNIALEITWTLIPLVLVCILFIYTYRAEAGVEALVAQPDVTVAVNAYRWGWTFRYLGGPTVQGAFSHPPQLVLPRDETTRIILTSSDVNHAFWVPAFLFKRDAIPGRVTRFDLRPEKDGSYVGHCAEFCGYAHALMGFSVKVVPPADFAAWLRSEPS